MPHSSTRPADSYSPLYFLAALGAGGLVVTFFMYLMFWVPHPGRPVPIFEDIAAAFSTGDWPLQAAIAVALAGIAIFAVLNVKALVWNLRQVGAFSRSDKGRALRASNAETQMTAMPLALAMTVNVGFILGLVFVPGLWGVVEYLFPLAMIAFLAIGWLAFRQIGGFLGRVLTEGGFDCAKNNSFAQLLPAFAFAMVGVGLAAPAAMSGTPLVAGLSLIAATFFMIASALMATVSLILGVRAMMENGAAQETAPTLLVVIPLLTVLGILMLRLNHGLHVHFDVHGGDGEMLVMLTRLLAAQLVFGLFGLTILRRQGYARRFLFGAENSPGAYALVCPGVALSVMLQFWINKGLVANGLVAKFSTGYWALSAVAVGFQIAMIALVWHLNRRHFGRSTPVAAVPAE